MTARHRKATRAPAPRPRRATGDRVPPLPMPPELYQASQTADLVTVPERTVLAIAGHGAPESEAFQSSIGALYGVAYTLKFARKKSARRDFRIGPLESRWWIAGDGPEPAAPREEWRWELRIAVPDNVTPAELTQVVRSATSKKGGKLEGSIAAKRVALTRLPPARYGRILHVGPYGEEPRSFARIRERLLEAGERALPSHLEVYLNDPRRTKPEKIRTALLLELTCQGLA